MTLGLAATAVFAVWSLIAYRASGAAREATRSGAAVRVAAEEGWWSFTPAASPTAATPGLLFFPGALVDPIAYAPLARAAAEAGFPARLVLVPRRGAFGGADDPRVFGRAREAMRESGAPARWVIAGHSRGGVIATDLAASGEPGIAGVVLIGTSHPRDVSLSGLAVPVTKIVGTRDGLASPDEVRANRALLPESTRWVWIDGGNHSQFGSYGFQPGDWPATISREAQQRRTVAAILDTLMNVQPEYAAGGSGLEAVSDKK